MFKRRGLLIHTPGGDPDVGPLARFVAQASGQVLVLFDPTLEAIGNALRGDVRPFATGVDLGGDAPRRRAAVAVVLPDVETLRRMVSVQPRIGRTKSLLVWLTEIEQPILLTARPEWPAVTAFTARTAKVGGAVTTMRFEKFVLVNRVLEQLARNAVPGRDSGNGGIFVAAPAQILPADPTVLRIERCEDAARPELVIPPDVVLSDQDSALAAHDVTGRAPIVVSPEHAILPPIDERLFNPQGFAREHDGRVLELVDGTPGPRLYGGPSDVKHLDRGVTYAELKLARQSCGISIRWPAEPQAIFLGAVAALAASGVPLTGGKPPSGAAPLGETLVRLIGQPADWSSELAREEHSVELRRAALLAHSSRAWRGTLANRAGLPFRMFPSVSVVLATKRPEQLKFALKQFVNQRGVEAELVIAAHGFTPEDAVIRECGAEHPITVRELPGALSFGDVLNAGVHAASGDLVLKMDDDDWYGPDFLLDLLVARLHSGADVVGTTSEYVYLEMLDRTLRRRDQSELFANFVAGGTILLDRTLLRELGGFRRARKFVDASLLERVLGAGGSIYRAHGLEYVLRRTSDGHTWDPGIDFFFDEHRMGDNWAGFRPSGLL